MENYLLLYNSRKVYECRTCSYLFSDPRQCGKRIPCKKLEAESQVVQLICTPAGE
jgi:hypothetical protein